MMKGQMHIEAGFLEHHRQQVAELYWQAFQNKLHKLLGPDDKALQFVSQCLNPKFALSALDDDGAILGVAGYKTSKGSLLGGNLKDLFAIYGRIGGLWRGLFLSILERDLKVGELLMDGIFVSSSARGKGVGTALLDQIKIVARELGDGSVRLDVIDTNPRARQLYERQGFVAKSSSSTGPFRYLFGFNSATTMIFTPNGETAI